MYACIIQLEAICQLQSEQYSMVYQSLCRILELYEDGDNEAVHVVPMDGNCRPHGCDILLEFQHTFIILINMLCITQDACSMHIHVPITTM